MKHWWRLAAAAAAAVVALAGCGGDDDGGSGEGGGSGEATTTSAALAEGPAIEVRDAWARSSPTMAESGAAYMVIENAGMEDDALVGVSVDAAVAGRAELHEVVASGATETTMGDMDGDMGDMDGDMGDMGGGGAGGMGMQPVERIDVPAGGTVTLEPGGYHVMLLELAAPLEEGASFDLALDFEQAGEQRVTVTVRT